MRRVIVCGAAAFALGLAGCGKPEAGAPAAQAAQAAAPANPLCAMFTAEEAGKYIGEAVKAGETAAIGTGCQWDSKAGDGYVQVQVVEARHHVPATGAAGYRALPDVGQQGFVTPELGGWAAGAIQGEQAVAIAINGGGASEIKAVELLKEALKRKGG